MDKASFGVRVRESRHKAKLTSDELSELCDCTPVSIRQIESGARLPSVPKLICLCNALKVSPNDLLGAEVDLFMEGMSDSASDERLRDLVSRIRNLPGSKHNAVCGIIETVLCHIERL